jgi:hypothetical protein
MSRFASAAAEPCDADGDKEKPSVPRSSRLVSGALFLLVIAPAAASRAEGAAPKIVLVPHRAVYDLSLLSTKGMAGVDEARGRLVFEITGTACDGYATNFRQVTELRGAESSGGDRSFDVRSASFESGDGASLRFSNDTVRSGKTDHVEGKARITGKGLEISVAKPEATSLSVTGDTLFPNAHIKRLIAEAMESNKLFSTKVYDGSDTGRKVYDTFAVIGAPVSPEAANDAEPAAKADQLKGHASWPVSLSYFEPGAGERLPSYQMSFILYDNGVSRTLKLNYGDFSLKGDLKSIEFLKPQPCDK